jgi:outer membrane receptor protein involved in Fe transport
MWRTMLLASAASFVFVSAARAQVTTLPASDAANTLLPTINVFATTPLSGTGVDIDQVPAAVTTIDSQQIQETKSPNIVDSLQTYVPSTDVQSVAGNPFQPDVLFRGFDASPVNGTPQGLAVYQNGVRINQSFGDTVNWDQIPTVAVRSMDVISNNPAFGLNALGGAISIQMKDGFTYQGGSFDTMGGSYGRIQTSLQYGKQVGAWATYIAVEGAYDGGYRDFSNSEIRRIYGDVGYKTDSSEFHLSLGGADNFFGASATAPAELLEQSWSSVYTTPQTSTDQIGYVNATANVNISPTWSLQGVAYFRSFFQATVDGNSTNAQICDPPNDGFLCFNDGVTPANGLNGQQLATPPSFVGATLGEIDRTWTQTTSTGTGLQGTNTDKLFGHDNHFVIGASFDFGLTNYSGSAELGIVQPNYVVAGSGIYLGPSGNPVSDGPVSLRATNAYTGLYALDTFNVTKDFTISAGGRANVANIRLQDQLGGDLNGNDTYWHINPLIGATYRINSDVTAYAGYSQANRAPTPQELGCADPAHPCILASFLVSDPPLKQVVAETYEAGLRGTHDYGETVGTLGWKLGVFRTDSRDDILNVPDPIQQGFGYFQNVGTTRRQGIEAEVNFKADKFTVYASYSYIDATFLNAVTLGSSSPYADANGNIYVVPGDHIPAIPANRFKIGGEYSFIKEFKVGAQLFYVGSQYYAGDASNQFEQLPAYAVVNADASYQVTKNLQVYALVQNVLNNRYYTYGTFFDTTQVPNYGNGGAPFTDPRSLSPAQLRSFYIGMRATF